MNEAELRQYFVDVCCSYHGYNEADGSFRKIIDVYNSIKPLPIGYRVSYGDAWCAAYVSAMAWLCELTDIIYPECGCDRMIALYKKAGRWQEADGYIPKLGDIIFYDWEDSGAGDNMGSSDHVGVVVKANDSYLTIIEGNISDGVGYRDIVVNGKFIRGYGLPNFAKDNNVPTTAPAEERTEPVSASESCVVTLPVLRKGNVSKSVRKAQELLIGEKISVGVDGADGDYGLNTYKAAVEFQKKNGLTADGIIGADTWSALLK